MIELRKCKGLIALLTLGIVLALPASDARAAPFTITIDATPTDYAQYFIGGLNSTLSNATEHAPLGVFPQATAVDEENCRFGCFGGPMEVEVLLGARRRDVGNVAYGLRLQADSEADYQRQADDERHIDGDARRRKKVRRP